MSDLKTELLALFTKWYVYLCYMAIGLIGKFSFDLLSGKKMSVVKVLASTGVGLFVGFLSALYCIHFDKAEIAPLLVPICTSLSEKLMIAAFAINYKATARDILSYWANRFK